MKREQSAFLASCSRLRTFYGEMRGDSRITWACRLCEFSYWEPVTLGGWPITLNGLYALVKHFRGHIPQ
jgi:hypothetical protein